MSSDARWLDNLDRANRELTSFLATPIIDARDRAGIIQAFEFTLELFWKTMQKLAPAHSLSATTPRAALQVGLRLGLIPLAHEETWARMLRDRNLTSHTYNESLAVEICQRIAADYQPRFHETLVAMHAL